MLYAVTYQIEGICGPGGSVDTSRDEIMRFAKSMAEIALHQMDDAVSVVEWYDLDGNETDPRKLLQSNDLDEVANIISQISDAMKSQRAGYLDLWEYGDIFRLIEEHEVTTWCSEALKDQIAQVQKVYFALVRNLSDEWLDV
jgi:hypothetical protein